MVGVFKQQESNEEEELNRAMKSRHTAMSLLRYLLCGTMWKIVWGLLYLENRLLKNKVWIYFKKILERQVGKFNF